MTRLRISAISSQTRASTRPPTRAVPAGTGAEHDRSAMRARDLLDDREAEAVALALATGNAVEALEHACAFGFGNAGTVVLDFEEGSAGSRISRAALDTAT